MIITLNSVLGKLLLSILFIFFKVLPYSFIQKIFKYSYVSSYCQIRVFSFFLFFFSGMCVLSLNLGEVAIGRNCSMGSSNKLLSGHQSQMLQGHSLCRLHASFCCDGADCCRSAGMCGCSLTQLATSFHHVQFLQARYGQDKSPALLAVSPRDD